MSANRPSWANVAMIIVLGVLAWIGYMANYQGKVRVVDNDEVVWEKPFGSIEYRGGKIPLGAPPEGFGEFRIGDFVMVSSYYFIVYNEAGAMYAIEVDSDEFNNPDLDVGSRVVTQGENNATSK